jgi:hypothetical protein
MRYAELWIALRGRRTITRPVPLDKGHYHALWPGDRGNTPERLRSRAYVSIHHPADTEALKIPNACNQCHADKTVGSAVDVLKSWTERSPLRMER